MRSIRLLLLVVLAMTIVVPGAFAEHFQANCPLSFVGSTEIASPLFLSPHGVLRNGSLVYVLRGQTLTTYNITELGDISVAREDFISSMANHDEEGGVAYSNGFMFVSGEVGLEIYDLRNVRQGGAAPILISRTMTPHYRRLTIQGNQLAAVYPAEDMPCQANGTSRCHNQIDVYNITNLTAPTMMASISSLGRYVGFNDIEFANGFLWTTGFGGTWGFDTTSDMPNIRVIFSNSVIGRFLESNGSSVLAVGQDGLIAVYTIDGFILRFFHVFTLPSIFNRTNEHMFHNEAYIDDYRLLTMINERDPHTRKPARTVAFDAFDFDVPFFDGADDRIFENVSMTFPDEVKYHPLLVGPFVHVIGEQSGIQKWGACDQITGHIKFDFLSALSCGGAELTGVIAGKYKISSVELYLDSRSLGFATLGDERYDVDNSSSPLRSWRMMVNMDNEARGEHVLRGIATDVFGQRRQFYAKKIFFPGPGENCTTRKRGTRRR